MAVAFVAPNSKMPGLNYEAPPEIRSLEYLFDQVFSAEQRNRLQLAMGLNRTAGAQYGIVDEKNPNSATIGSPLCVIQNATNLTVDISPGIAVTKAGNIIVVPQTVYGLSLANTALTTNAASDVVVANQFQGIENVVLLEYTVVDDATTNTVTEYNTVEAQRRIIGPVIDETQPVGGDITKKQIIKIVSISDFLDVSKFTPQRLNDVVVLAIVKVVSNSSPPPETTLSIDMSNAVNTYVRPWFSPVDQQHRAWVGTGSSDVPHNLSYNDLGGGALTLYQQALQYGIVLSRDIDVPGCPGKYCSEFVDATRILTDADGSITGTSGRTYVRLSSYPNRILGARANIIVDSASVEDKSLSAASVAVELLPTTNILCFGRRGSTNDILPTNGMTVYYTDSTCLRPPALPHDIMLVANDIIQFQSPSSTEEYVTGGKIFNVLPATQYAVGINGPIPKNYSLWIDGTQQFVESPQVVSCAKLINDATGVGTATQSLQFPMYGVARIRAALWNAPTAMASLDVRVLLNGIDSNGSVAAETLIFSGNASVSRPNQVAWDQSTLLNGEYPNSFQISNTVFSSITSWQITKQDSAGANALIQLWAEIEPTTTSALDDAAPVCAFNWNGQSVAKINDIRTVVRSLSDVRSSSSDYVPDSLTVAGTVQIASESFKNPVFQDVVLSKRNRHSRNLSTVFSNESLGSFAIDGTIAGREWYYSQAIVVPAGLSSLKVHLFGDTPRLVDVSSFGSNKVEWQVAQTPSMTWSGWNSTTLALSLPRVHTLSLASYPNYFKIRLRIAGRHLSGFALTA